MGRCIGDQMTDLKSYFTYSMQSHHRYYTQNRSVYNIYGHTHTHTRARTRTHTHSHTHTHTHTHTVHREWGTLLARQPPVVPDSQLVVQ